MKLHSYVNEIILTHCMSFVKTRCFLFKWTTIADTKVLILSINKKLASFYSCGIIYMNGKSCERNKSIWIHQQLRQSIKRRSNQ